MVARALELFPLGDRSISLEGWLRKKKNWPGLSSGLAGLFCDLISEEECVKTWWRPSPFREILTVLYEGRAAPVRPGLKASKGNVATATVAPLLVNAVDPLEAPTMDQLVWHRTECLPRKGTRPLLRFQEARTSIHMPMVRAPSQRFLPDLAFLLDSSGSMNYQPYKGKGEYDLLLRTVFGVFQWLRTKGLASFLRYAVLNFSEKTVYSGWLAWQYKDLLNQTLFQYQGGSTSLDPEVLQRLVRDAKRPFTAIMVTDGELDNAEEALECIAGNFQPPRGLILVQIEEESEFARGLRERGFRVHLLENKFALRNLVLGELKERYPGF